MHFRRVMIEQFGQSLTIATALIDRVILTSVLLRAWGHSSFEMWSVCVATAGLASLFDLGFSLYFNNRLMQETEQNRVEQATRTFRIANGIFAVLGSLSFAALVGASLFQIDGLTNEGTAGLTVLILAVNPALKIATSGFLSLYRANRQYARLTFLQVGGEIARIVAMLLAVFFHGGLLAVAVASTVTATVLQVVIPVCDAMKRFPPFRIGFQPMPRSEMRPAFLTSLGLYAQSIPITLLASLPVLYLEPLVGVGILATFVLIRMLAGLPRNLLQQFGTVLGQECGRCIAARDHARTLQVVVEGARLHSILSGTAAGLLLACGSEIVFVWTGSTSYFRFDYLAAAVSPMLLASFAVLAHNILGNSNAPRYLATGRWLQLALTTLAVTTLPMRDPVLRMLLSLSLGEVLGFAPIASYGVSRLVPGTSIRFLIKDVVTCICAAGLTAGLARLVVLAIAPASASERSAALGTAMLLILLIIPWVAVRSRVRRAFVEQFIQPHLIGLAAFVRGANRWP